MPKYPNKNKYNNKTLKQSFRTTETFSNTIQPFNEIFKSSMLHVESLRVIDAVIYMYLKSSEMYGICPYCGAISYKVHSVYIRTLRDLPVLNRKVNILFQARKFFCKNTICSKKTFAEQPGDEICRYRRRTKRCETIIGNLGVKMSAINTRLLLKSMQIPVSPSTVLRTIYRMILPDCGVVTAVGVDDWAFRKGVTYGSILVDLKTGDVIDLLADRETESFECWIRKHTDVNLVSRDRSTNYSSAIANTGRGIAEVADRFHLVKNMSDCVTKVIIDNYSDYRNAIRPEEVTMSETTLEESEVFSETSVELEQKNDPRINMFNEVKELQFKGFKINAIARKLHIARQTVRKYMQYKTLPKRRSNARNEYYKYDQYVENEYAKGETLKDIYEDILNKGFEGSITPFYYHYKYLSRKRVKKAGCIRKEKPVDNREPLIPVKNISAVVFKSIREYKLNEKDKDLMGILMGLKWFESLYKAAESFYKVIMGNKAELLDQWIEEHRNTTLSKLRTFIIGIKLDIKAVRNAIIYPVSNGIVEGFVNKLKAIKRIMYGRASLELLKRKMIFTNKSFQLK